METKIENRETIQCKIGRRVSRCLDDYCICRETIVLFILLIELFRLKQKRHEISIVTLDMFKYCFKIESGLKPSPQVLSISVYCTYFSRSSVNTHSNNWHTFCLETQARFAAFVVDMEA